jgi:predicted nucleotidyltransferase component of viral defense system
MADPRRTYPTRFDQLAGWASDAGVPGQEARRRFAQFVVLSGIAATPALRRAIVFKGGNALDFALQANRSTLDLDFSMDPGERATLDGADAIRAALSTACAVASARSDVGLAVHRVRQHPPGADRTFVTYEARVGYALPDEQALRRRMTDGRPSPNIVPVEISINEPICGESAFAVATDLPALRIATLEDIVSEKLRAILQQVPRNRHRPQDLLDITVILRGNALDRDLVADYLQRKSAARDVPVTRSAFHGEELRERTQVGYDALAATTRVLFIPFEEAMAELLAFTDGLAIPA